jgi:hypothetical protein
MALPVSADQVEDRESILVADDSLAVEQAGAHRQHGHCRDDLRKAVREVFALPGQQLDTAVGAPGHDAETVVLDLVNPSPVSGRLLSRTGEARLDEASRWGSG